VVIWRVGVGVVGVGGWAAERAIIRLRRSAGSD